MEISERILTVICLIAVMFLGIIAFSQRGRLNCIRGAMFAAEDKQVSNEILNFCMKTF